MELKHLKGVAPACTFGPAGSYVNMLGVCALCSSWSGFTLRGLKTVQWHTLALDLNSCVRRSLWVSEGGWVSSGWRRAQTFSALWKCDIPVLPILQERKCLAQTFPLTKIKFGKANHLHGVWDLSCSLLEANDVISETIIENTFFTQKKYCFECCVASVYLILMRDSILQVSYVSFALTCLSLH